MMLMYNIEAIQVNMNGTIDLFDEFAQKRPICLIGMPVLVDNTDDPNRMLISSQPILTYQCDTCDCVAWSYELCMISHRAFAMTVLFVAKDLHTALVKISSPTQDTNLLLWQIEARAALTPNARGKRNE